VWEGEQVGSIERIGRIEKVVKYQIGLRRRSREARKGLRGRVKGSEWSKREA